MKSLTAQEIRDFLLILEERIGIDVGKGEWKFVTGFTKHKSTGSSTGISASGDTFSCEIIEFSG